MGAAPPQEILMSARNRGHDLFPANVATRLFAAPIWGKTKNEDCTATRKAPWNKGKLVGQKTAFKQKEIWAIRVRLQMAERARELALFKLGIDSKLRACDLTALRVRDICHGNQVASRAIVLQRKTRRPVQFEITAAARESAQA